MNLKGIINQITKYSEWVVGFCVVLISYNFIFKPVFCPQDLFGLPNFSYCTSPEITFIAICIMVVGIVLTYKKIRKNNMFIPMWIIIIVCCCLLAGR